MKGVLRTACFVIAVSCAVLLVAGMAVLGLSREQVFWVGFVAFVLYEFLPLL